MQSYLNSEETFTYHIQISRDTSLKSKGFFLRAEEVGCFLEKKMSGHDPINSY